MTRRHRIDAFLLVLAFSLWSSACRKTVLKGQIAVGGSDVRNIAVRVVPERDIKAYLDNKVHQALVALDERQTGFERASRAADSAIRDYQMAFDNAHGGSQTRDGVIVTPTDNGAGASLLYDPKQHTEAEAKTIGRATLGDANRQRAAAAERFGAEKPLLDQALTAGRQTKEGARSWWIAWETDMLADLPEVGTVLYTDEKGRFTKREPRGGKVAVFASGDFNIGGTIQHRGWGLWVTLDAAEKELILNTNNFLLGQPRDSVLR